MMIAPNTALEPTESLAPCFVPAFLDIQLS